VGRRVFASGRSSFLRSNKLSDRRAGANEQLQFAAATQTVSLYREPCLARVCWGAPTKTLPLQGSVCQGDDSNVSGRSPLDTHANFVMPI